MHSPIRLSFIYNSTCTWENVEKARLRLQTCGWWRGGTGSHWSGGDFESSTRCPRENERENASARHGRCVIRWRPLAVCQARSRTGPEWELGAGYTADPRSMPPNSSYERSEIGRMEWREWGAGPLGGAEAGKKVPFATYGLNVADRLVGRIKGRYALQLSKAASGQQS